LGIPSNFNGFRVLASLLQRRRSTETSQTLHDIWPSHGLVNYLYIFGGSCPVTEFCQVQNSLCVLQVLHCPILAALLHGTRYQCFVTSSDANNHNRINGECQIFDLNALHDIDQNPEERVINDTYYRSFIVLKMMEPNKKPKSIANGEKEIKIKAVY